MTAGYIEPDARHIEVTWASTIRPRAVRWAWRWQGDGRIPAGSLSLAAGREGTGKSSFGIWLAAQITSGSLEGAYYGTPRSVLYVAVEDSWEYTLVPRLMAAGADLSRVGRVAVRDVIADEEVTMSLPQDNTALEDAIRSNDVALVVVDPLMSLLGDGLSASKSREVRRMLDPLVAIANRTDSIILGIAHHNKGSHTDPIMAVSESKAFTDVPRSVFAFARDEDNECRVMSQTKNSLGKDAATLPSLSYDIESVPLTLPGGEVTSTGRFAPLGVAERSVADLTRDAFTGEDSEERSEAELFLLDFLGSHGGEAVAGDVIKAARAAGFNDQTIKNARRRCREPKIESRKASMAGGWVWAFAAEGATKVPKVPTSPEVTPSAPSVTPSQASTPAPVYPDEEPDGYSGTEGTAPLPGLERREAA